MINVMGHFLEGEKKGASLGSLILITTTKITTASKMLPMHDRPTCLGFRL